MSEFAPRMIAGESAAQSASGVLRRAHSKDEEGQVMRRILLGWGTLALAMALAAAVLPGFDVKEGVLGYVVVALVFGLVNSVIGPMARLVALPITLITLGIFAFVVNGAMLAIAAWITPLIELDGFGSAIVAALVISVFSAILAWLFSPYR
jgi:putative membrane protein